MIFRKSSKSEKTPEEYEEQSIRRENEWHEQQRREKERYEKARNRAVERDTKHITEAKAEDATNYGGDYDRAYRAYEPEVREAVNGYYEEFYDEADAMVGEMNLEQLQDFCSSPEDKLEDTADGRLYTYFDDGDEDLKESSITSYCEDSPVISNRYELMVRKASKEELFSAARREEREQKTFLLSDMFALKEVKRRKLHEEYVKSNN